MLISINIKFFLSRLFSVVASNNESQQSILTTVQQEMTQRRKQKTTNGNAVVVVKNGTAVTNNGIGVNNNNASFITRQDSRLSVKSLIESIENTSKPKGSDSQSGSNTSLNMTGIESPPQRADKNLSETDREKQQLKTLNNNNSINNNNNSVISTTNGTPKSGKKF